MHLRWIASDECETPSRARPGCSHDVDAMCVPGGFGIRGIEGKLGALKYARVHGIPTLGLCLGLQCMVIEYARNVAGLEKAASTEFDPDCPEPVIATMEEQKSFVEGAGDLGGTMRLGLYPASLAEGTVVRQAYGAAAIQERHRHRYEVNNAYRDQLAAAGLVFSGTNPELGLVEFVELPRDGAPLLRRHPGAPRAALAADPPAPAVRGAGRGGHRAAEGAAVPDRRRGPAPRRRGLSPRLSGRGRRYEARARSWRAEGVGAGEQRAAHLRQGARRRRQWPAADRAARRHRTAGRSRASAT